MECPLDCPVSNNLSGELKGPLLHKLLLSKRIELIEMFIDEHPESIYEIDEHGNDVVNWCVTLGNEECLKVLINKGCKLNKRNEKGINPLIVALQKGRKNVIEIIEKGMHLNWASGELIKRDLKGFCIMHYLAQTNYLFEWCNKYKLQRFIEDKSNEYEITPLFIAAQYSNSKAIKDLITLGADPMEINSEGQIPLMISLEKGDIEGIKLLFKGLQNNSFVDKKGRQLIHYAIKSKKIEIVAELLKLYGYQEKSIICLQNCLYESIESGKFDGFHYLVNKELKQMEIDFNKQNLCDNDGFHLIHYTIHSNCPELIQLVCVWDKDALKRRICNGWTPLLYSISLGRMECCLTILRILGNECLLEKGNEGENALQLACYYKHKNLINLILKLNYELINLSDNKGNSSFHYAAAGGECAIIDLLYEKIKEKKDIKKLNELKQNILQIACLAGQSASVLRLIDNYEIDPKQGDQYGNSAFHYAVLNKQQNKLILNLLSRYFKEIPEDIKLRTPLHIACCCGNVDLINCIIKQYPKCLNKQDSFGKTALHYAVEMDQPECVDMLLLNNNDKFIIDSKGKKAIEYSKSSYIICRLTNKEPICIKKYIVTQMWIEPPFSFSLGDILKVVFINKINECFILKGKQLIKILLSNCKEIPLKPKEKEQQIQLSRQFNLMF